MVNQSFLSWWCAKEGSYARLVEEIARSLDTGGVYMCVEPSVSFLSGLEASLRVVIASLDSLTILVPFDLFSNAQCELWTESGEPLADRFPGLATFQKIRAYQPLPPVCETKLRLSKLTEP